MHFNIEKNIFEEIIFKKMKYFSVTSTNYYRDLAIDNFQTVKTSPR